MVRTTIGDIFKSNSQTLVNTINCVGVMGKGIALGFKQRFPEMYKDYVQRCEAKQVKLGCPYLYRFSKPPFILNFPTKDHWRSVARLQDIIRGLEYLENHYRDWGISSLAVPPLGCGEGKLEWRVVGPTLYRHLSRLTIPVELYAPFGTPQEQLELSFLEQPAEKQSPAIVSRKMDPAWVALVEILSRIEKERYHWPIGRTSFQKIAYFATQAGIPTGLEYKRGSFGPYSSELKAVTTKLVNNGIIHEECQHKMFLVKVGPTFEDARNAYRNLLDTWEEPIERIADLFVRMRTQQAEVASTVDFAARSLTKTMNRPPNEMEVLEEVMKWKQRRQPPLSEVEVAWTIRNLAGLGWLHVLPSKRLSVPEEQLIGA